MLRKKFGWYNWNVVEDNLCLLHTRHVNFCSNLICIFYIENIGGKGKMDSKIHWQILFVINIYTWYSNAFYHCHILGATYTLYTNEVLKPCQEFVWNLIIAPRNNRIQQWSEVKKQQQKKEKRGGNNSQAAVEWWRQ